jgi:hypothetical protein
MSASIDVTVTVSGPLMKARLNDNLKRAVYEEAFAKFEERINRRPGPRARRGRGLGMLRNTVTSERSDLTLIETSTLIWPRTKGRAWTAKNIGIVKSMAPRVIRKVVARMLET